MLKTATKFAPETGSFQNATDAGFRFAELWLNAAWVEQWRSVVDRARRYPLGYAIHFPNRGEFAQEDLENVVSLLRGLNGSTVIIHRPMFARYGERLQKIDPGLRLAVENSRLDSAGMKEWARNMPWLTLDIEHLWMQTLRDCQLEMLLENVDEFLSVYGEKLAHVHLPGYSPGTREHRPMHRAPEMVEPVLTLFQKHGFEGLIVSEASEEEQVPEMLRRDVQFFEEWCAKEMGSGTMAAKARREAK